MAKFSYHPDEDCVLCAEGGREALGTWLKRRAPFIIFRPSIVRPIHILKNVFGRTRSE